MLDDQTIAEQVVLTIMRTSKKNVGVRKAVYFFLNIEASSRIASLGERSIMALSNGSESL